MNNFSPNMLKVFEKCPFEFYLKYVQKLALPTRSKIFEKGKKIHALANYYLKGFDIEKMEQALSVEEKAAWGSLKNNKYFQFKVVDTEYNLSCKVGDFWVGGRLDALMKEKGTSEGGTAPSPQPSPRRGEGVMCSSYYILDYKTGNIPKNAEFDFQTMVYLLAADKFLAKKGGYESLKFVYLGLKNNSEKEIILSDELKKQYEENILAVCKNIESSISSNNFNKNCAQCDGCEYKKICS